MRSVTEKTVKAFLSGKKRKVGHTVSTGTTLLLHNNLIAERMPDGSVYATLAGWGSRTTRERLNGLCELLGLGRPFHQCKNVQFYGSLPISLSGTIVLVRPDGNPVTPV